MNEKRRLIFFIVLSIASLSFHLVDCKNATPLEKKLQNQNDLKGDVIKIDHENPVSSPNAQDDTNSNRPKFKQGLDDDEEEEAGDSHSAHYTTGILIGGVLTGICITAFMVVIIAVFVNIVRDTTDSDHKPTRTIRQPQSTTMNSNNNVAMKSQTPNLKLNEELVDRLGSDEDNDGRGGVGLSQSCSLKSFIRTPDCDTTQLDTATISEDECIRNSSSSTLKGNRNTENHPDRWTIISKNKLPLSSLKSRDDRQQQSATKRYPPQYPTNSKFCQVYHKKLMTENPTLVKDNDNSSRVSFVPEPIVIRKLSN